MSKVDGFELRLPPVIVALDTDQGTADELVNRIAPRFDRADVGFKVSHNNLFFHRVRAIGLVQRHDRVVVAETRLSDSARNNADFIESLLIGHDIVPDALTMFPHMSGVGGHEEITRQQIIEVAHSVGTAVIGFSEQPPGGSNDQDHLSDKALIRHEYAKKLGFDVIEVMYAALEGFSSRSSASDSLPTLVSKFRRNNGDALSEPELISATGGAFALGASSVLLGSSVVASENPVAMLQEVLSLRDRILGLTVGDVSS